MRSVRHLTMTSYGAADVMEHHLLQVAMLRQAPRAQKGQHRTGGDTFDDDLAGGLGSPRRSGKVSTSGALSRLAARRAGCWTCLLEMSSRGCHAAEQGQSQAGLGTLRGKACTCRMLPEIAGHKVDASRSCWAVVQARKPLEPKASRSKSLQGAAGRGTAIRPGPKKPKPAAHPEPGEEDEEAALAELRAQEGIAPPSTGGCQPCGAAAFPLAALALGPAAGCSGSAPGQGRPEPPSRDTCVLLPASTACPASKGQPALTCAWREQARQVPSASWRQSQARGAFAGR